MTAGKRRLIIPAVLGALWLCAFALLVATESRSMIRENTAEITAECQTLWTLVKDAAAGNTADAARIAAYQQAMAGGGRSVLFQRFGAAGSGWEPAVPIPEQCCGGTDTAAGGARDSAAGLLGREYYGYRSAAE